MKNDKIMYKIVEEVAKEMGIPQKTVWLVYVHFYNYVYKLMTKTKLATMTKEYCKEHAVNINIPGFGRILSKYGRTKKSET